MDGDLLIHLGKMNINMILTMAFPLDNGKMFQLDNRKIRTQGHILITSLSFCHGPKSTIC